ncbi:hypothetical protein GCM10010166_48510 [Couchioplanes caeruleus subsp. azureus]|nr:hypothetical protein GCM10010166_48510 [Couchioplanes caeruleus subsp. azureus]
MLSDASRLASVRRAELALPGRAVSADAAAHLAARALAAPMGFVTLVSDGAIRCAGLFGAPDELMMSRTLPLTGSLCPLVASAGRPLVLSDLSTHPEYATFAAVVRYNVQAYIGVPLRDRRGRPLGAVAAADTAARSWTDDDLTALQQLAEMLGPLPEGDPLTDHHAGAAAVLDALGESLVSLHDDGRISEWNAAATGMFGWSLGEALGRSVEHLMLSAGDWTRIRAAAGDCTTGSPWRQQCSARHRDGHTFPVELLVTTLDTPSGRRWGMVLLDGAERAAADRLSVRRSGFLHAVLDSLYTGIAACDADGRIVLINRALRQAQSLPGDGPPVDVAEWENALFTPDGAPLRPGEGPLTRACQGSVVRGTEVVLKAADTPALTFAANAEPMREPDGTPAGAVVALHDITMQRRADRFRSCELQVATILSGADEVTQVGPQIVRAVAQTLRWPYAELWLLDPVSDTLRNVGHWLTPDVHIDDPLNGPVVEGQGITGTVWADNRPVWVRDVADTTGSGPAVPADLAAACARAGLHTAVGVPIGDGAVVGVLTCFADSCQYDEAEIVSGLASVAGHIARFLSRAHIEGLAAQLDRTRDDFIALVGHEMRTPLTSIGSYIQFLLTDEHLDPELHEMLSAVDRNTALLTAIVDDLLDLAALQSGRACLQLRPTDVTTLVRDSLDAIRPAAHANHVRLTFNLPDHLTIDADPQRLRQVIDNLLSNAVKYSPDGGAVHVSLTTSADTVILSVCDTGIGIPTEERTHLFRTFFRATNARHTSIPGTGLGLVVTHAIVEAHHGLVTATHNDPGTTFTIRLPATAAATD